MLIMGIKIVSLMIKEMKAFSKSRIILLTSSQRVQRAQYFHPNKQAQIPQLHDLQLNVAFPVDRGQE